MAQFLYVRYSYSIWLAAALALALLAGCVTGPVTNEVASGDAPQVVEGGPLPEAAVALEYHILAGELAVQRGDRAVAAREYVAALAYSDNPELAQRAARVALFAGEPELAYRAARAWSAAEPNSEDAHKTAARLALRADEPEALSVHAAGVVNQHSNGNAAGLRELADLLSGEPEHADTALQAMRDQVQAHTDLPEAYYALGLLALRYERLDAANQAAQQALALKPAWNDAALLRAGVLIQQGDTDQASSLVDNLDGSQAERADFYLNFARLLLDAEQTAAAADAFEHVLALQPSNTDARYGLGLLALSLEQPQRAKGAFTSLYASGERRDDSAYYLGNIEASRENYSEARKWYMRVDSGSHAFDARLLAARALYKSGDLAGARSELQRMRQANSSLADRLYMSEAELLYDARQFEQALALYNEALESSPYESDLLYGRSLVYERLGMFGKAETDLKAILEREPDNARALNALGYMLTNNSDRYQEALEYIQQALDAEPEDPSVIDSMGWVQYRLGNLQEAREHLQRAYELFPDPEVAAHLGEVLWQLGEQTRAQEVWQEALAEDPGNTTVRETMQRLTP